MKFIVIKKMKKKRYKDVMLEHENFLISKRKFVYLICEIMYKYFNENLRIQFVILNVL